MITITSKALEKAKEIRRKMNKSDNCSLELRLNAGGCSGFSYEINFIEDINDNYKVFNFDGLDICCDKKSYFFLIGTEIDWEETLMSTGFKFNSPLASGQCGCGESISFDKGFK